MAPETGYTRKEIDGTLENILVEDFECNVDSITNSASLKDDLMLNSRQIVELVMKIEETFEIEISDEDADKMNTFWDITEYLCRQLRSEGRLKE